MQIFIHYSEKRVYGQVRRYIATEPERKLLEELLDGHPTVTARQMEILQALSNGVLEFRKVETTNEKEKPCKTQKPQTMNSQA